MKAIIILITTLMSAFCTAQVLINRTTASSSSVVLEFGNEAKGIVLEPIDFLSSPSTGTLIFDDNSGSFRYFNGTSWSPVITGGTSNSVTSYPASGQIILNDSNSAADGIFIIEDDARAMVLPVVPNGALTIKEPSIGHMYYDPVSQSIKVFNGVSWTSF
tara:strand:- start:29995 stop:30474 length:480 start_codon:yes stop_codon:yes gene_type:complete